MRLLRSLSMTVRPGHLIRDHSHEWGQLVFTLDGAIDVFAGDKAWLIPPARAVYVPPLITHSLYFRRSTSLRTVYIPAVQCKTLEASCTGLFVSGLLKELILETCRIGVLDAANPQHGLIDGLLVAQIAASSPLTFTLTLPRDRRALSAALAVWSAPGSSWDLERLAAESGASARTLQRFFVAETGLPFSRWLQRARLFAASNALLDGDTVTGAGLAAGYASTSAFIATFKNEIGMTPLQYKRLTRPSPTARLDKAAA